MGGRRIFAVEIAIENGAWRNHGNICSKENDSGTIGNRRN